MCGCRWWPRACAGAGGVTLTGQAGAVLGGLSNRPSGTGKDCSIRLTNRPRAGVRDCAIAFADSLSRFVRFALRDSSEFAFVVRWGAWLLGRGKRAGASRLRNAERRRKKTPPRSKGGVGMGQVLNGQQIERAGLQIVTRAEQDRLETRLLTGATTRDADRPGVVNILRHGVERIPAGSALNSGPGAE